MMDFKFCRFATLRAMTEIYFPRSKGLSRNKITSEKIAQTMHDYSWVAEKVQLREFTSLLLDRG